MLNDLEFLPNKVKLAFLLRQLPMSLGCFDVWLNQGVGISVHFSVWINKDSLIILFKHGMRD